jgi:hypothetical protein
VEDDVLDKGNLIPLLSEVRTLFEQDWIAQKFLGKDFDSIFFKKNTKGEFDKKPVKVENSKDVESILPQLKKGIKFIVAELGRNNQYYLELTNEAKNKISNCGDNLLELDSLWDLAKIIASELINKGFNQSYIYDCIQQSFFDPQHPITSIDDLDVFFDYFSSTKRKYSVYLPLNSIKQKRALDDYGVFKIAENVYELFDSTIPYILKYKCEATDPYNARERALDLINFCLSVNQFIKHNKYDYNPKFAEVFDQEKHNITFIRKPEMAIARGYTPDEDLEVNDLLDTCLELNASALQVLQLHSAAMTSKNSDNQLINLWTAIEVAVPVARKDGLSRINQISNTLTAALGENYFSTLIHQLLLDIKTADANLIEVIESIGFDGSLEAKLLAIIILQKYADTYNQIKEHLLPSFPLLVCRMHRYQVRWSSADSLKKAYQLHAERLSQQLMRIYRTRNMLVHDGTSLPYADYVLQNLHYYVDSFVRFLSSYYKVGYRSVQTIVDAAQFKEQLYLKSLSGNQPISEKDIAKYLLRK